MNKQLVIGGAVLVVLLLLVGGLFVANSKKGKQTATATPTPSITPMTLPSGLPQRPTGSQTDSPSADKSLDGKEAQLAAVVQDPGKYIGNNVTVGGQITTPDDSTYYLMAGGNRAGVLLLDLSQYKGNIKDFVGPQVKVTGKVAAIKQGPSTTVGMFVTDIKK